MKKLFSRAGGLLKDDLLRHTGILFSGMMMAQVCNMAFQMLVGRALPEAEYTLLAAFLATLAMIQSPLGTLTTGVAHYSSLMCLENRRGDVKRLLRKWLMLTGIAGMLCGGGVVLFCHPLAGFLHLDRTDPVVLAGLILPALFLTPVLMGVTQGLQMFKTGSAAGVAGALVRTGVGAGLVWLWVPACGWAMVGHGLGSYVMAALLLAGTVFLLQGEKETEKTLPSMRLYLLQSFLIQAAYAVLLSSGVVMVKHFVPADTEFAYAATLGSIVVFLPGPIVVAMFPMVASAGAGSRAQQTVFLRSLGLTGLFVVCALIGCVLFPGLLARILFGIKDASVYLKQMIGLMAAVMGIAALLNVTVQFLLAQRCFAPAFSVVAFAVVYLAGVQAVHGTAWHIAGWAAGCNGAALLTMLLWLLKTGSRENAEG